MSNVTWRSVVLTGCLALLVSCGGGGGGGTPVSQDAAVTVPVVPAVSPAAALRSRIDSLLATRQNADSPGISILVMKNDEVIYNGGKGTADSAAGIPISENTGFYLASVSKPFTALAIMQLVEKKQIGIFDSVLDYIPELPASWRPITIDQLLSHRSGIYDIINDGWQPSLYEGATNDTLIKYLIQNPALEFTPGSRGDYSNTGYMLLSTIIERKTGMTFPAYMTRNVYGPANMKGSYVNDENQAIKSGDALNYARLRTQYGFTSYFKGATAQVSSTNDFLNFFAALRSQKLVSAAMLDTMTQSRGSVGPPGNYGYGFQVWGDYYGHGGQWDGYETDLAVNRRNGVSWAILTNSGSVGRANIEAVKQLIYAANL